MSLHFQHSWCIYIVWAIWSPRTQMQEHGEEKLQPDSISGLILNGCEIVMCCTCDTTQLWHSDALISAFSCSTTVSVSEMWSESLQGSFLMLHWDTWSLIIADLGWVDPSFCLELYMNLCKQATLSDHHPLYWPQRCFCIPPDTAAYPHL